MDGIKTGIFQFWRLKIAFFISNVMIRSEKRSYHYIFMYLFLFVWHCYNKIIDLRCKCVDLPSFDGTKMSQKKITDKMLLKFMLMFETQTRADEACLSLFRPVLGNYPRVLCKNEKNPIKFYPFP